MAEGMTLEEQAEVAKEFLEGLLDTYGFEGTVVTRVIDEETVEVAADGEGLGLLVGPKGSTLAALQDVTRTVVQRRCPSRTDRILVDVAGYREKRSAALQRFSQQVAAEVIESGSERALEPMSPADRKVVHDADQRDRRRRDPFRGRGPVPPHRDRPGLSRTAARTPSHRGSPRAPKAVHRAGQQPALLEALGEARELGLLGPGPLERPDRPRPGLRLGRWRPRGSRRREPGARPGIRWWAPRPGPGPRLAGRPDHPAGGRGRRVAFLRRAVERCGLEDRVSVVEGRAEEVGRDPQRRAAYQLVVARSFGRPATTAECAAPFLEVGGALVVSETPEPARTTGTLERGGPGLARAGAGRRWCATTFGFAVIRQLHACPDRFPRRVGVPAKRPLF